MSSIEAPGETKIVTFSLGSQMFGIDMKSLVEIREWDEPTPLPGVPLYILGVSNLRGTVVPVIGLAARLGWQPSKIHARSCVLVVSIGGKQAGFLVDEVGDIVNIKDSEIQPAPDVEISEPSAIAGLVQISMRATDVTQGQQGRVMVSLLDLNALSLTGPVELAA